MIGTAYCGDPSLLLHIDQALYLQDKIYAENLGPADEDGKNGHPEDFPTLGRS